jgi:hypothetical protein
MRVNLENTSKIVEVNGIPCRIWEGWTDSGIEVHAYVTRIAVSAEEKRFEEFEAELRETRPPSAGVAAIPLRLIL